MPFAETPFAECYDVAGKYCLLKKSQLDSNPQITRGEQINENKYRTQTKRTKMSSWAPMKKTLFSLEKKKKLETVFNKCLRFIRKP